MTYKLIGITGRAGAGKDTAANQIRFGGKYNMVNVSFASPLKFAMMHLLGDFDTHTLNDPVLKNQPSKLVPSKTNRELMQLLGTEFVRKYFGEDFWLKRMELTLEEASYDDFFDDSPDIIAITDVRFDNEAQYVRNKGGIILEIVRPNNPFEIATTHASEQGVSANLINYTILNDRTIADLENKVSTIADKIMSE